MAEPLYFGLEDEPAFGWYHAAGASPRGSGVVLCGPMGAEGVRAHRALRHLAERLSAHGYPVLRFDYRGTGDSAGTDADPGRVKAWLEDVRNAVAELQARSGVSSITLIGLRLGATLAVAANASVTSVEALVLWHPCVTGAAYVRETRDLHAAHQMLERRSGSRDREEALGFVLTDETAADLGRLELMSTAHAPARDALVVGTGSAPEAALARHLEALGIRTTLASPGERSFLVTIPRDADVPERSLATITDWIERTRPERSPAPSPEASVSARAVDLTPTVRELPLRIPGPSSDFAPFGVLTLPSGSGDLAPTAVVLLNAGCCYRIGPTRAHVELARRWADAGFVVLRLDLPGLGDSPAAPGERENLDYPRAGPAAIEAAFDQVTARSGVQTFVLAGLCSGADNAFLAARADRRDRVRGVILLNPRSFGVLDLDAVTAHDRARYYESSAKKAGAWQRVLSGQTDLRRAAGIVGKGIEARVLQRIADWRGGPGDDVATEVTQLTRRGVRVLLVGSTGDPGIDLAERTSDLGSLDREPGFHRETLEGADHVLTSRWAQERFAEITTDHLLRHYRGEPCRSVPTPPPAPRAS